MESSAEALERLGCVRLGLQTEPTGKKPKHSDFFFQFQPLSSVWVNLPKSEIICVCVKKSPWIKISW